MSRGSVIRGFHLCTLVLFFTVTYMDSALIQHLGPFIQPTLKNELVISKGRTVQKEHCNYICGECTRPFFRTRHY